MASPYPSNMTSVPVHQPWTAAVSYAIGDLVVESGLAYKVVAAHTAAIGGATQPSTDAGNANYVLLGAVSSKFTAYEVLDHYVAERMAGDTLKIHESDKAMLRRGRVIA